MTHHTTVIARFVVEYLNWIRFPSGTSVVADYESWALSGSTRS